MPALHKSNGQFVAGTHWREPQLYWDRAWLAHQYSELKKSAAEIASTHDGWTENSILFWLRKHGIPRRSVTEARAIKHWGSAGPLNPMFGKFGSKNPNYVDGSSPERQRLYARGEGTWFLRSILKRDGYKCRRCGLGHTGPRTLHVHHIKPWAGNISLRFDAENAVTLCRGCHRWVHSRANLVCEYLS